MKYFISDLHFCHDKEFIWKARGYNSVEEMNDKQVEKWNSRVKKGDVVYVLGDFCLDKTRIAEFASRLNGEKHLIYGNHDHPSKINYTKLGFATAQYAMFLKIKNKCRMWLCHYPTIVDDGTPRSTTKGVIVVHGHLHLPDGPFYELCPNFVGYNVAADFNCGYPIVLDDIIKIVKERME